MIAGVKKNKIDADVSVTVKLYWLVNFDNFFLTTNFLVNCKFSWWAFCLILKRI